MKNVVRKLILPSFFFFVIAISVSAQENSDSTKVLFIGNSYTRFNEMPAAIRNIASSQGVKLSCTEITPGGYTLGQHLDNKTSVGAIEKGGWDYVVIQEQSLAPAYPTEVVAKTVYPAARSMVELIRTHSPRAKIIFYMTWGRKYGWNNYKEIGAKYPLIYEWNSVEYPHSFTYEGMQMRLMTSYLELAYINDGWCAPVGMAWQRVRKERPDYTLYRPDLSHPSDLGSYLAANVIFTVIYQRRYQTGYVMNIPREQAEYIQQVAQQTVFNNLELLNIRNSI